MSAMIEKMARNAWEQNRARVNAMNLDFELPAWEDELEACREDWRQFARDMLAAMREPTPDMIRAVQMAAGGGIFAPVAEHILVAGIDAAAA